MDKNKSTKPFTTAAKTTQVKARVEQEAMIAFPADPQQNDPAPFDHAAEPVVVSSQLSTYIEGDRGPGSFAVQLRVGSATITTCVKLDYCSDFSLSMASHEAAMDLVKGSLDLARMCERHVEINDGEPPFDLYLNMPDEPEVHRDDSWVTTIHTTENINFDHFNTLRPHSLETSAAFAEFAFNQTE